MYGKVNIISSSKFGLGIFGFVVGIFTGLIGLGGGYALVLGLIHLFTAPVYITIDASLATMIPLTIVGAAIKITEGFVFLSAGLMLAIGAIFGA